MSSLNPSISSSLRPRNRRLISGLSDDGSNQTETTGTLLKSSPFGSPRNSRAASPIPNAGLTRTPPRSTPSSSSFTQSTSSDALSSLSGFWGSSWSSLQGLASNVLGQEDDQPSRRRKPLNFKQSKRSSVSALPAKWGVSTTQAHDIGAGSKEQHEHMVRDMKRRDLLNANGHIYQDTLGKFKRRNSDDRISSSAPPADGEDRDALVYVHHVKPSDTLAGLSIKYTCQAEVLRKANRMWSNDTIQARKTVVIPVDACGVKGRRCPGPREEEEDLLGDDADSKTITDSHTNGWPTSNEPIIRPRTDTLSSNPPASTASTKSDSDPPWIHDSWVKLPHDLNPIEIARLPRRKLGFFPPPRRKSVTFSDSVTPTTSLDLSRSNTSTSPQQPYKDDISSISSAPPINHNRTRSRKRSVSNSFALLGPGGVGSLGKNVRSPGPGEDALNKFFVQHFPNMQVPPGEYFPPLAPGVLGPDGAEAIRYAAANSKRSGGFDLEQVVGAFETWTRKQVAKVSASINEHTNNPGNRQMPPIPGLGADAHGLGDLIELRDDAFEIGEDEDERVRGRRESPGRSSSGVNTARPDVPLSIRERGARSGSKNGKGD